MDIKEKLDKSVKSVIENKDLESAKFIVENVLLGDWVIVGGRTNAVILSLKIILAELDSKDKQIEELKHKNECVFKRYKDNYIAYTCSNCDEDYMFEYEPSIEMGDRYCQGCGSRIKEFTELEEETEE